MKQVLDRLENIATKFPKLILLTAMLSVTQPAWAVDYTAVQSGDWSSAGTWSPAGIPGQGDTVTGLGSYDVSISSTVAIGVGTESVAINVDGSGRLILEAGSTLSVFGHLLHSGWRGEIIIGANARLLFAPAAGQQLELQQNSSGQRITFAGSAGARGLIGLATGAAGGYHFSGVGFRDSRINGAYGYVEDAFDPATERGWTMYMSNDPVTAVFDAHHIEFRRCGGIAIFGREAAEHNAVNLDALTFRAQSKSGNEFTRPSFWFDGYLTTTSNPPASSLPKRVTNVVSDTKINLRFVSGYVLDDFVLDGFGSGGARSGNNAGNALSHNNVFMANYRGGSSTGILADEIRNSYFYMAANNPHGWSTLQLRGDALISNFWFESSFTSQSDNGDAVLTNAPQEFVTQYGGVVPTLTIEHSGTIGDGLEPARHPVLLTLNPGGNVRFVLKHNIARVADGSRAIALDENGVTPSGTGIEFVNSIVYADNPGSALAISSPSTSTVIETDPFLQVDHNLYHNLSSDGVDGSLGVHGAIFSVSVDANSMVADPQLVDATRNLATWDASLGGPGTAVHAIEEMKKRNDDVGFNPEYTVEALTAFVAEGHATTNPLAIGSDGLRMGPAIHGDIQPPPSANPIFVDLGARGVAAQDGANGTGYLMYSIQNVRQRFRPRPNRWNYPNFIAVRQIGGLWHYDNGRRYTEFTPLATDLLVAGVDFGADTVTALAGTQETINGLAAGYESGNLVYAANRWNGRNNMGEFEIQGTMFVPWL